MSLTEQNIEFITHHIHEGVFDKGELPSYAEGCGHEDGLHYDSSDNTFVIVDGDLAMKIRQEAPGGSN